MHLFIYLYLQTSVIRFLVHIGCMFTKEIMGKIISLMTFCTPKDNVRYQDFHCECGLRHVLHVREKLS